MNLLTYKTEYNDRLAGYILLSNGEVGPRASSA